MGLQCMNLTLTVAVVSLVTLVQGVAVSVNHCMSVRSALRPVHAQTIEALVVPCQIRSSLSAPCPSLVPIVSHPAPSCVGCLSSLDSQKFANNI